MYDKQQYNELKHTHSPAEAFRRSMFAWAAADVMLDVLSVGGSREDFLKATNKLAAELVQ